MQNLQKGEHSRIGIGMDVTASEKEEAILFQSVTIMLQSATLFGCSKINLGEEQWRT